LGGTHFLGRHIVQALQRAGHHVTVFNRGHSADALDPTVKRLRGDRELGAAGLEALQGLRWDACVDVSGYTPDAVRASAECLCGAVQRYVFVSAVMVYGQPTRRPVFETHPRVPAAPAGITDINSSSYGPLKVACEDMVQAVFGARGTVLRPQVVVGPGDTWQRYTDWVQRAQRATEQAPMLAPGDGNDHLQMIDVRDLARFVVTVLADDLGGAYNLAGPRLRWSGFVELLAPRHHVWVPASILQSAGLSFQELPLYRPERSPLAGLMDVSHQRALAAGLRLTEPRQTLQDVRADELTHNRTPLLSAEREAALVAQALRLP
jgi:2'-hydroxyisoflavone reductase